MQFFHSSVIFNCIVISVVSASDTTTKSNGTVNIFTIRDSIEFYDSLKLIEYLDDFRDLLTANCSNDLDIYINALRNRKQWALKVDDSNGRYSGGWLWGNDYWLGSKSECQSIQSSNYYKFNNMNHTGNYIQDATENRLSPSQSEGYNIRKTINSQSSPYALTFFVIKVKVNSTQMDINKKYIKLGLCLPLSCQNEDVELLVRKISLKSNNNQVIVISVKSEHNYYDIFQDTIFWILCSTTGIAILLGIIGTSLDLCTLRSQQNIRDNLQLPTSSIEKSTLNGLKYIFREILLAFSVRINVNIICDNKVGSDTIATIHGIKFISMVWIILAHTGGTMYDYMNNKEYIQVLQKEFIYQIIPSAAFGVDTFFFTSGLLVSFLYFRTNEKGKLDILGHKRYLSGFLHFVGLIAYRFARLSVPYIFIIGLASVTTRWFRSNTILEPVFMNDVNCKKYWWRNILYINSLYPKDEMCMMWTWYISNDTQFFVLGSVLLVLATRHIKLASLTLSVITISSWLTTGYISLIYNYLPSSNTPLAMFDNIYDKPWTRVAPYLIGMSAGWLLFKKNCEIKISPWIWIFCTAAAAACLLSLVLGLHGRHLSTTSGVVYSSLSHSGWATSLAWIVIACRTGYGGFINTMLSSPILYPLSRVTYCVYLLHPLVMQMMVMFMEQPFTLGKVLVASIFAGQLVIVYALGFVVSIIYEAPVVSILRILSKVSTTQKETASVAA